ncbi:MAG: DUF971 domain-containing protein [Gammaproteobacteria bacterium]|nr:DUF971 domain-containing protein [Gammaproteobacteria bacterium]
MSATKPTEINFHKVSQMLEIAFNDGSRFSLPAEYLRVYSPSAEVQGHGPGQEVLQVGKEDVKITQLEPVGHYAVSLIFDDNHDSGIYSWDYLYQLGAHHDKKWETYLERLQASGYTRKTDKLNINNTI